MTQSFSPPNSPSQKLTQTFGTYRSESSSSIYSTLSDRHLPPFSDPNSQTDPGQTFYILVASDCHLGYADRDEMRRIDSFQSFEEVLDTAVEQDVDFVLLGGDLFHENKPSRFAAQQCANLLRHYCMGDRKTSVQLVSDPEVNFAHMAPMFRRLNTKDPDLKISLPVFSIHGNHDDPSGSRYLSELDLLHTYGLVNYFGKVENIEEIEIEPLLFKKGRSKLAIYGLGSIRDERLHRAHIHGKVKFVEPPGGPEQWFDVFILHQNRPSLRGGTNYIPETFIPDWMDLVIWGHEHDPIHIPEKSKVRRCDILQPGSTVATSMSDGEKKQKYCYRLEVCGGKYRTDPIPLKTVRPFVMEDIDLKLAGLKKDDITLGTIRADVEKYLTKRMERIIRHVEINRGEKQPKEPLVRLRVDFGNIEPLNPILFGQKFVGRVANPRDIILPVKSKEKVPAKDKNLGKAVYKPTIVLDTVSIEDLVVDYFVAKSDEMVLFDPKLLTEALREFVQSDDKDAVMDMYEFQKGRVEEYLSEMGETGFESKDLRGNVLKYHTEHSDIPACIKDFRDWRAANKKPVKKPAAAARGRGRGRGGATTATQSPPRRRKAKVEEITIDDDDSEEEYVPSSSRTARGGRGGRSRAASQTASTPSSRLPAAARAREGRGAGSRKLTEYFDVT
ncbi:double-strand break repair protein MRE11-like [Paramacrobiotus metropolitanus]|uniref:double-strand break repair protein MRE11-like n=1 Tax=Paramacrobiotus metropolitanus TaxID=2943436 RepID=UPI0024461290|nr:double-strand break repair protein MRE11-like [Paramacrobiotus metropolitanus]